MKYIYNLWGALLQRRYNHIWLLLLLLMSANTAYAASLNIHASNALSGEPLKSLTIYAFEAKPNGEMSWRAQGVTNTSGLLSLELAGLGQGLSFVLLSVPYNGGFALSEKISQSGSYEYQLGSLVTTVVDGDSGSILANHLVIAAEIKPDGSKVYATQGRSDANGVIRFDLPGLGKGRRYFLHSQRPVDNRYFEGAELSGTGQYTFVIGQPLLKVRVIDGLSGQPLLGQAVHLISKQSNGQATYIAYAATDSLGRVNYELGPLTEGTHYELITEAYNGIATTSSAITTPGSYDFKVGQLKATVISGASNQPLTFYKVGAKERLPDGSEILVAEGLTDANGDIRFDLPGIESGRAYVLYAQSPVDNSIKKSKQLTKNGTVQFVVGSPPLNVTLANHITGEPLGGKTIVVVTLGPGWVFEAVASGITDSSGNVSFDLDALALGRPVFLLSVPFNSGWAVSDWISAPGKVQFDVGKLPIKLVDAATGQPLPNREITLLEQLSDGKTGVAARGITGANGVVMFDTPRLNKGTRFSAAAANVFGDGKDYYSPWITAGGAFDFVVARDNQQPYDDIPPKLAVFSPTSGQNVSAGGFVVTGVASDEQRMGKVYVDVIDPSIGTSTNTATVLDGNWSVFVPKGSLTASSNLRLNVRAYDFMGNQANVSINLTAVTDTEAPMLQVHSHGDQDTVSTGGFMLTGLVSDNLGLLGLTATLIDSKAGVLYTDQPVEISPQSGNWALPIQPPEKNSQLQVSLRATDYDGQVTAITLSLNVVDASEGVGHLLNRITFGATEELLDRTRGQAARIYRTEQLNWEFVDDSELESMLDAMGDPVSHSELQDYQLIHALFSERQLLEKMTWFWENHFNTDLKISNSVPYELEENRQFRTHALGKFRDLLQVSATSPAMLIYLDNVTNIYTEPNENYARELFELHTMGVTGGYSEQDIAEAARVFTGWTIVDDQFSFRSDYHDNGGKTVLGQSFGASSGVEEGNQLLDFLASHPATARNICTKLIQYFVADVPSANAVTGCSSIFLSSEGDIAAVVDWILQSGDFRSSVQFKSKVKSPMEFLVGVVRATQLDMPLEDIKYFMYVMGMSNFYCPSPTGWPEKGVDWANADQLAQRMQAVNYMLFSSSSMGPMMMSDPVSLFLDRGIQTQEGVLGYLTELSLLGQYSGVVWEEASKALGQDSVFDIHAMDASDRIRAAMAVMFNSPDYHLQ